MKIVERNPTGLTIVMMVIAALVVRAGVEIALDYLFPAQAYWIAKASQMLFYLILMGLSWSVMRQVPVEPGALFGRLRPRQAVGGIAWAVVLLGFSLGSGFLFTYLLAQIDLDLAYSSGHFHPTHVDTLGNTISGIVLFAVPQFLLAPFTEELVFRGLLLRLITGKRGLAAGVIVSSLLFTLFHFSQADYIGTFIFAVVLSVLYIRTRTLWVPIIVHSTYNVLAYIQQGMFDFHWTRTKDQMLDLAAWKAEIGLLCVSTLIVAGYLWRSTVSFRLESDEEPN